MKVLFSNEAPLIKYGLAAGFIQAGHEVKVIQGEYDRLWGQPVPEQIRRLTEAINSFKPDFMFTEGHPGFDLHSICQVVRKLGIPHLYWAIEDPVCTQTLSMAYAPLVDYIFTTTVECIPQYEAMGKKAELLLFGCNPEYHYFTGVKMEYAHDIVLVASNYSSRYAEAQWFILPLIEQGYDIKIWGIWWDDPARPINLLNHPEIYGGLLPYEELAYVYSSAKIILGMNCDDSSKTQTSMRPYEALACGGGLYLAHYTQAQQHYFGDIIFQARNKEETIQQVETILGLDEGERKERAYRAQQEVYTKHSYRLRAEQIIRSLDRL
jgi:spore maturation protein CgeB